MLCKRIIPCLDVSGERTVKGVSFQNLRPVGDPAVLAARYQREGADEIVLLDIAATPESRSTRTDLVRRLADLLMIPLTVGGGISRVEQARELLESGADKVAVNTAAVARPGLLTEISGLYGSQCCVLAIDAQEREGRWRVLTHSGSTPAGLDALCWAAEAVERGAGEILLTSWDRDGTTSGFDLALTREVSRSVRVPVIASGGAGQMRDFLDVLTEGMADAALAASVFHDGVCSVSDLKRYLADNGVEVRL